jgi:hypothetical protein
VIPKEILSQSPSRISESVKKSGAGNGALRVSKIFLASLKFFLTKPLGHVRNFLIKRQKMDQLRFYQFGSGFNFYWFYFAEVYPLRLADR